MNEELRIEIELLAGKLQREEVGSAKYTALLDQMDRIIAIDERLNKVEKSKLEKVLENPALLGAMANLAGILLILNYERASIVTSRAISFIRPK
jgi:hypothetical protein